MAAKRQIVIALKMLDVKNTPALLMLRRVDRMKAIVINDRWTNDPIRASITGPTTQETELCEDRDVQQHNDSLKF